jgi:hypothetical protein
VIKSLSSSQHGPGDPHELVRERHHRNILMSAAQQSLCPPAQRCIAFGHMRQCSPRAMLKRFEWHYTPKHGSWLDLAESELGVLSSQCLDRRIPDKQTLIDEIAAWERDRNAHHTKSDWHFTAKYARIKLKYLYPSI